MSADASSNSSRSIEDIVQEALTSGDLTKLRELRPVVKKALGNFVIGSGAGSSVPRSPTYGSTSPGATSRGSSQSTRNDPVEYRYQYPSSYPNQSGQQPPLPNPADHVSAYHPQSQPVYEVPTTSLWKSSNKLSYPRPPRGYPQIVFGLAGTFFFGICSSFFLTAALPITDPISDAFGVAMAAGSAAIALASGWFMGQGIGKYLLADRVVQLANLFRNKKHYTIDELAAETKRTPKQVRRDLRKILAKGMLPEIRTDPEMTYVMWGQDVYKQYLLYEEARQQSLLEEQERRLRLENPATADIERFRSEGKAIVQKIRAANDAISGKAISAKLDTLEDTTKRIFIYVERYPEKLPDTRKFMNYYLPTTIKLVEKYQQFDRMDFEPGNVRKAKAEIERSLDTINVAFNNLLESLFTHDTLDVVTDIDVLEKLFEQEGLTGNKFRIDPSGSAGKDQ